MNFKRAIKQQKSTDFVREMNKLDTSSQIDNQPIKFVFKRILAQSLLRFLLSRFTNE